MEHTRKKIISCIEKGVKYTGKNVTKKHGRPYLISSSSEINLIANSMEKRLGLCYTNLINNWHHRIGTITQTINNFSLNHNHRRSVEHTWKKIISYLEKGVKYTGKNVTKKHGRPYLIYSSS